jgi:hypothetical protein
MARPTLKSSVFQRRSLVYYHRLSNDEGSDGDADSENTNDFGFVILDAGHATSEHLLFRYYTTQPCAKLAAKTGRSRGNEKFKQPDIVESDVRAAGESRL